MDIQEGINLKPYNTFHLDCIAKFFVVITKPEDFLALTQQKIFQDHPHLILGGGSNILLTKDHYDGIVIKNEIMGKTIVDENDTQVIIRVGAGENRNEFVQRSINQGYCGIENLISIPGNVGAAPMQNIGAYGVEVKSVIQSVEGIDYSDITTPRLQIWSNEACAFGYRDSIFKQSLRNQACITAVTFVLQKYHPTSYSPTISYGAVQQELEQKQYETLTPHLVSDAIAAIRASKLPDWHTIGTAGSFFKNPLVDQATYTALQENHPEIQGHLHDTQTNTYKLNAGQLIELSGLKGLTQGAVGTYQNHALVLVNHGGGTGAQLLDLAQYIQARVYERFGVALEAEVNLI